MSNPPETRSGLSINVPPRAETLPQLRSRLQSQNFLKTIKLENIGLILGSIYSSCFQSDRYGKKQHLIRKTLRLYLVTSINREALILDIYFITFKSWQHIPHMVAELVLL